jgi:hypothetical protein
MTLAEFAMAAGSVCVCVSGGAMGADTQLSDCKAILMVLMQCSR